jgi:YVTN family beta-propeller protein
VQLHAGGAAAAGDADASQPLLALVTNWADDTVSLVDMSKGQELSTIRVGAKPYDVKVDPAGRFAYVTNSAGSDVSVIDIQAMLEKERIAVGVSPRDIAISRDGTWAVTANSGDNTISVVDLTSGKQKAAFAVGAIPYGVALSNDEKRAVITNWGENTASIVDLTSGKELSRLKTGTLPYTAVVPPGSDLAFVSSFGSSAIYRINLKSLKADGEIPVGRSPWGLAASGDGKSIVSANYSSNELSFMSVGSGADFKENARVKLPAFTGNKGPDALAAKAKNLVMSADGKFVVYSDLANNTINLVDSTNGKQIRSIAVGRAPYGIAQLVRQKQL